MQIQRNGSWIVFCSFTNETKLEFIEMTKICQAEILVEHFRQILLIECVTQIELNEHIHNNFNHS